MDLVTEHQHLVLTYVAAVTRAGATLTKDDLEAYAVHPTQVKPYVQDDYFSRLDHFAFASGRTIPAETTLAYLLRVRWVVEINGHLELTPLGRIVLQHADRPPLSDSPDEPLTVTIDPEDDLAYTKIFALFSSQGSGLLVDPYFSLNGLESVMKISFVDRVLTGDKEGRDRIKNGLTLLRDALERVESAPEVRAAPHADLHDRFFIPDRGSVYMLGSSLNSITARPGIIMPVQDPAASAAIRKTYRRLWAKADQLTVPATEAV